MLFLDEMLFTAALAVSVPCLARCHTYRSARLAVSHRKLRMTSASASPKLVVSQAHYDPPAWVDLVINNALHFTAADTYLILHLNPLTAYEPHTILRWHTTPRVRVARRRLPVEWGRGSLTLAHAL